jgi:S1-C subfamily serine protease
MSKNLLVQGVLILFFLGGFFFLYLELYEVRREVADLVAKFEDVDARTEGIENKITTLKKESYVETDSVSSLTNAVLPSVVFITQKSADTSSWSVLGTGFFIRSDGYVATAKHVVAGADTESIAVKDTEGALYSVESIYNSNDTDVSLVKIKTAKAHPVASFGYFENLEMGSGIGIIGFNPGFSKPLLHTGTVSALGTDEGGSELFTINAFVNKGNSGSPVFSLTTGRIVGILSTRQADAQSRRLLNPEEYQSGVSLGGTVDPVRFSAELYNETVRLVEEVSQVGIGIIYSVEIADKLLSEI